jgi:hypothetical protein
LIQVGVEQEVVVGINQTTGEKGDEQEKQRRGDPLGIANPAQAERFPTNSQTRMAKREAHVAAST